jgi:hypothetical protein
MNSATDDTGEMWRAFREEGRQRRAENTKRGTDALIERGIAFTSHNGGAHLIIKGPPRIDYFPATGLFKVSTGASGRGVKNLIRLHEAAQERL